MLVLNDVHSQLNPTPVDRVLRPASVDDVRAAITQARRRSQPLSIAGGRHAMGGQQFAAGALHLDMTGLADVIGADAERGLLHIGAGATWPRILAAANAMRGPSVAPGRPKPLTAHWDTKWPLQGRGGSERSERGGTDHRAWAIRQKQTGVDEVTLGGSIAANAHGRGLLMPPLVDDIESLVVVDAQGRVLRASRDENAELFSLVVGGYGLFGVVVSATLRLVPRQRVQRLVDVLDLRDAMHAVRRRVDDGCTYGDFQFAIDPRDRGFLMRGVFACCRPVDDPIDHTHDDPGATADLSSDAWLELLRLAHTDKAAAFRLYAQHYLGTHGRTYWADAMQLATYLPSCADFIEPSNAPRETLVIGEQYVPRDHIADYMERAREVLLRTGTEVIYGTIRSILRDTTSFLPWARDDYACVVFNLRTPHTDAGRARTGEAFRGLIQAALDLDGSFFLTYHRHATREQLLQAYPRLPEFLARKLEHDPSEAFQSDWYRHVRGLIASA
jgi:FAD/FMN-containing dehydrogenase